MRISTKYLRTTSVDATWLDLSSAAATVPDGRRLKKSKSEAAAATNDDLIRTTDSNVLRYHGNEGPFGRCRGDCDADGDCMPGLVCFERDGRVNNVPGCGGMALLDVDYCISPADIGNGPTFGGGEEQREDGDPNTDSTQTTESPTPVPTPTRLSLAPTPSPSTTMPTFAPSVSPTSVPTATPTTSGTVDVDDDEIVDFTPTPNTGTSTYVPSAMPSSSPTESSTFIPTTTSSVANSKVIAAIKTGDELTSSQAGANTFDIKSTSGYAVMGVALLSLLVLAIVGLAIRNRNRKRAAATAIKNKPSLSTVIVPYDDGRSGSPRWGDGSTINQLTQAFESESMGIEVIDLKTNPSIRSAPSVDSFDAEPNPLPYDESLHKKYPKLFGLPERDEAGEIGPMDTIEL